MNIIKQKLEKILKNAIQKKYNLTLNELIIENPPKKNLGDFSFPTFQLSKELKKNPAVLSLELSEYKDLIDNIYIEKITSAWPYLNIKLSNSFYDEIFIEYNFWYEQLWNNEKIIIDYIWANVWKPMHIWHMCTPSQWQAFINLYKKLWYDVIWDSHIWDWGIIFWKLILAYKKWWEEEKLKQNAVDYLLELYVKITKEVEKNPKLEDEIRNEFKKLSMWDNYSILLWKSFTSESIKAMNKVLSRLWVKPDYNIWESFYEGLWLPKIENYPDLKYSMKDIVSELIEKNIATKNEDGSVWVVFDDDKIPSCMLQKRDGTHWYLASDLAAIKYRMDNWNPKKIIYFVDVRQKLHFIQVFEIARLAWWLNRWNWEECELFHAYNWFISLKDWAMSSRKWNIIKLDKLLDESQSRAKKIILEKRNDIDSVELEELSEIIWIWAIKYWYLSKSRTTDIVFDWDEAMTFEWNSWPYLQYAYVRALKIIEKSWFDLDSIKNAKPSFSNNDEVHLFKEILEYEEVLKETHGTLLIHNLTKYIYNLTKIFSSFYNNCHILSESNINLVKFRLKLVSFYIEIMKDAFEILSIKLPNRM